MADTSHPLKVFLCHASEDKPLVRELFDRLRADGFDPWLDSDALLPGQDWDLEIQKAMRASHAVIVCFSSVSAAKEGYVQKEIKYAQEIQQEKPEGTIFFIPLQLEDCEMPFRLRGIQWGKYFEPDGYEKLVQALNRRAEQVNARQGERRSKPHPTPKPQTEQGTDVKAAGNSIAIGGDAHQSVIVTGAGNVINVTPSPHPAFSAPLPTGEGLGVRAPGDLPPGSFILFPRNALFTGRQAHLEQLASLLLENHGAKALLSGVGGVGKSQLAVEFAYRYGYRFRGAHWLNLADPAQLKAEIARNGEAMRLPNFPPDQPSQVEFTLRAWKSDGPRLLILDNFEQPARVNDLLRLLGHSNLRLLVTSRRTDWSPASGLTPFPLEGFTPQESLDFLQRMLTRRRDPQADLARLAERLGHLPLALELASRYLNAHPRLAIADYLTQLQAALEHPSLRGWRADLPTPTEHKLDLLQTFALSWLEVKDETARKVFLAAGYLAPNAPIPPEVFEKALGISPEACDEALTTLYDLGLLKADETNLPAVHPLLADYARHLAKEQTEILEQLADALDVLSDEALETELPARFAPLRPHLPLTAAHAEVAGLQRAGSLWNNYGYHLKVIADYAGARAAFERAIKILEANLGSEHSQVAAGVNNLGSVLHALGDLAGAREAFERALKMGEATFGPDHPKVAIRVNNLGGVLQDMGDLAGARAAYERALKIFETQLGEEHPNIATLVNNLGMVLQALGDLAGARAAFERALKIDEAAFGPDHPNVATDVNNLGGVLQALGDLAGARAAFERALKMDEAAFGPDHPNVARDVNNLGMVLKDLGDLAGARAAFKRALKIFEKHLGEEHPQVAAGVNNLGSVLQALGDLAGARAAFERVLGILEKTLPPEHPYVASTTNNLGSALQALGDLAGARAAFKRALKMDEAAFGPDHPNVARDVNNLGMVLKDLGDLAGARAAFERALKIFEKHLGEEYPNVATLVNNLGSVLQALGDLAGAKEAYERALKMDEATFGPDHPNVAIRVNNLGGVLYALGDLAGARAAFERAIKIWEANLGAEHPQVAAGVNNLGSVLQALGDLAGARAAYERALNIFKKFLPPDHPNIKIVQENLDSLEE